MDLADLVKYSNLAILTGFALYPIWKTYRNKRRIESEEKDIIFIKKKIKELNVEIERMHEAYPVSSLRLRSLSGWTREPKYHHDNCLDAVMRKHTDIYEHMLRNIQMYPGIPDSLWEDYIKRMEEFDVQLHNFYDTWPVLRNE